MAKVKIPHVLLLIDRDASTKIPALVPEYEQPILEEIYGEDLVHELEDQAKDIEVEDFDAQKAFDGLVAKYQPTPEGDRARKFFYPKLRDLEKKLGIKAGAEGKQAAKGQGKQAANQDAPPAAPSLLDGTVDDITAGLTSLSDDELDALLDEEAAGKDRKGVHAAIEAERNKRAANQ
ncbi:hypothetical protein [uncultured Stenotrophomonas sp.]|uniref:hypothetical protein n=1 Tax=uncultured Stenotrophomonas sp. TaxID=165438 RepID=UPI0028F0E958|nr:hypothetical protein [uncultured Stenotrophomonas sp.]